MPAVPPPAHLSQGHGRGARQGERFRTAAESQEHGREQGELRSQPRRLGQAVVGLPDALAEELPGGGRQSADVDVRGRHHARCRRPHGAHQLQVLEQHKG